MADLSSTTLNYTAHDLAMLQKLSTVIRNYIFSYGCAHPDNTLEHKHNKDIRIKSYISIREQFTATLAGELCPENKIISNKCCDFITRLSTLTFSVLKRAKQGVKGVDLVPKITDEYALQFQALAIEYDGLAEYIGKHEDKYMSSYTINKLIPECNKQYLILSSADKKELLNLFEDTEYAAKALTTCIDTLLLSVIFRLI